MSFSPVYASSVIDISFSDSWGSMGFVAYSMGTLILPNSYMRFYFSNCPICFKTCLFTAFQKPALNFWLCCGFSFSFERGYSSLEIFVYVDPSLFRSLPSLADLSLPWADFFSKGSHPTSWRGMWNFYAGKLHIFLLRCINLLMACSQIWVLLPVRPSFL